jgi:hypothetical protein
MTTVMPTKLASRMAQPMYRPPPSGGSVFGAVRPSIAAERTSQSSRSSQIPKPGGTRTGPRRTICTSIGTAKMTKTKLDTPSAHHSG